MISRKFDFRERKIKFRLLLSLIKHSMNIQSDITNSHDFIINTGKMKDYKRIPTKPGNHIPAGGVSAVLNIPPSRYKGIHTIAMGKKNQL